MPNILICGFGSDPKRDRYFLLGPPLSLKNLFQLAVAVTYRGEDIKKFFQLGPVPGKPQQRGHRALLTDFLSQQ